MYSFACPVAAYCPAGTEFPIVSQNSMPYFNISMLTYIDYSLRNAIYFAQPCPAGTFSDLTGQDSVSDCTLTPAGKFSVAQSSTPTGDCAVGYYCIQGSTSATAQACPAGTYNPSSGGTSILSCRICLSGFVCAVPGTVTPSRCPIGMPPPISYNKHDDIAHSKIDCVYRSTYTQVISAHLGQVLRFRVTQGRTVTRQDCEFHRTAHPVTEVSTAMVTDSLSHQDYVRPGSIARWAPTRPLRDGICTRTHLRPVAFVFRDRTVL